jgi:hypothetical protein
MFSNKTNAPHSAEDKWNSWNQPIVFSSFLRHLTSIRQRFSISFEVKLPSACSFIVDGLVFCCRCSTLHVSAYMAIFKCVWYFTFYSWRNLLRCFCCLCCMWLYYAISNLCLFVCCVSVNFHILVCVFGFLAFPCCLSGLEINGNTTNKHKLETFYLLFIPEYHTHLKMAM